MNDEDSGFLSRKFLLTVAVLVVASWFRVAHLIEASDWIKVVTAVLAVYGLANVSQTIALGAQKVAAAKASGGTP